ncbi:ABC transporter permease [Corynebacterium caspium]|uniref:ABC transporter permease n=1 Tax=Corynebacterium caspium TaxID=234828 RepID=UPI0003694281|nr:iron ABC transporter permease [Corynebacterium caspium]WKD59536.1 Sulfate transport system permease protein CysW [Corynebacterium caspium DSM 44850]
MKIRLPWLLLSAIVVALMVLPLLGILSSLFKPSSDTWAHIQEHLLWLYLGETARLLLGTLCCSIVLASALAWVITAYDFPGRSFLSVALVLPLAIPPYIGGYTYAGLTGYTGAIQVWLREVLNWTPPPGLFNIMNLPGAIFIFTIFLYPYIYLVIRAFLERQANQLIEASRMLGSSRFRTYWQVVLPLTRNAVVAGATLVAFEVLSDYGVVSYFGLQVFTTAIFKSWLGYNDVTSALRLAGILLLVVTIVTVGEKSLRGARSHSYANSRVTPLVRVRAKGWKKLGIMILGYATLLVALIIPLTQMIYWAILSFSSIRLDGLLKSLLTSFILALCGATLTTIFALIVANHQRLWPTQSSKFLARITVMGYSIPSTVIALSILSIALWVDRQTGWGLSLTPALVVLAYTIRYLAVSMQSVESGFEKVGTQFAQSSRMLGRGPFATLLRIDIPMMPAAVIGGFLLAFIDMVKELPIVLILRPFNFSTLSTRVFEYANDEQIPESSFASLIIIGLALVPLLLLVAKNRTADSATGGSQ